MILVSLAVALACTGPEDSFDGFVDGVDGAQDVVTDWHIPVLGTAPHKVEMVELVDDAGNVVPVSESENVSDYYGADTLLLLPDQTLTANTRYTITVGTTKDSEWVETTASFSTGAGPAAVPTVPKVLSVEAVEVGDQTNDCVVGTHTPRELTIEVDLADAEPWSRIEIRNDDLRKWVSKQVDGPGMMTLELFQPVMDDRPAKTDCYTATLVSPSGERSAESAEFCLDTEDTQGCGCATGPGPGVLGLPFLLLAGLRRRGTAAPRSM